MPEGHEIRITLQDVYNIQQEQIKTLATMSAKLDLYIGLNTEKEKTVKDHEERIRKMERWVYAIPGIAFITSIAGVVIAILRH